MKRFHANNRLLLAKLLRERVPADRFDISEWVGEDWQGDPGLSCGTKACAVGWASAFPEFQEMGLIMVPDDWSEKHRFAVPDIAESYRSRYPEVFQPRPDKRWISYHARPIHALWGEGAVEIFVPTMGVAGPTALDATAEDVAQTLERSVAEAEKAGEIEEDANADA